MKKISVKNSDNTVEQVDLVNAFRVNDLEKRFAILSKGESVSEGMGKLYISEYIEDQPGVFSLIGINNDEDWLKVKQAMKVVIEGNTNDLPLTAEVEKFINLVTSDQKVEINVAPNAPLKTIGIAVSTIPALSKQDALQFDMPNTNAEVPSMPGAEVPNTTVTPAAPAAPVAQEVVQSTPAAPAPVVESAPAATTPVSEVAPAPLPEAAPVAPVTPVQEPVVEEAKPVETVGTNVTPAAPVASEVLETPVPEEKTETVNMESTPVETPNNDIQDASALETFMKSTEPPVLNTETAVPNDVIPEDNTLSSIVTPEESLDDFKFSPTEPGVKEEEKKEEEIQIPVNNAPQMPEIPKELVAEEPTAPSDELFSIPSINDSIPAINDTIPPLEKENNIPQFDDLGNLGTKVEEKIPESLEFNTKEVDNKVEDTPFTEKVENPIDNMEIDTLGSTIGSVLNNPMTDIPVNEPIEPPVLEEKKEEVVEEVKPKDNFVVETPTTDTITREEVNRLRTEVNAEVNAVFDRFLNDKVMNNSYDDKAMGDIPNLYGNSLPKLDDVPQESFISDDKLPEPPKTEVPKDVLDVMNQNPAMMGQTSTFGIEETPTRSIGRKFVD